MLRKQFTALELARHCGLILEDAQIAIDVMQATEARTGVTMAEMMGVRRHKFIARARQIAYYEAHKRGMSASDIARAMLRDHTTVIHGIRVEAQRRGEVKQ